MSGFADVGKKLEVSADVQQALSLVDDVVGAIGAVSSVVGIPGKIIDLLTTLGIFTKQDPVKDALDRLSAKVDEIVHALSDSEKIATLQNIATQTSKVLSAYFFLKQDAKTPPGDQTWPQYLLIVREAIHTLEQHAYYERPFFPEEYYTDPWAGTLKPPTLDGEAFDYRLALPGFLNAALVFIEILRVFVPNYATQEASELDEVADRLAAYHDLIANALVALRPPAKDEVIPRLTGTNPVTGFEWADASWNVLGQRHYGVVDPVAGLGNFVARFPTGEFPDIPVPPPSQGVLLLPTLDADYARFRVRHQLKTIKRRKQVYAFIGLPSLWSTSNRLRALTGRPALDSVGLERSYSMRSVRDVFAGAFPEEAWLQPGPGGAVSLARMYALLGVARPARVSFAVATKQLMGASLWGTD